MTLTLALIGPSMPRMAQLLGGLISVISEVEVRSEPPIRRVIMHRDPTAGGPSPSMCPLTTPDCHSPNRDGSVT